MIQVYEFVEVSPGLYLAHAMLDEVQCHVTPDGKPAYQERYSYVGSFQRAGDNNEFRAVARDDSGSFHITLDGKPAYQDRYLSVSEFRHNGIRY